MQEETEDQVALARAVAAGDEGAFVRFYDQWFPATLALARAACRRDEAFCLDVVQDVMLRVAGRLPPLRSAAAVGAWIRSAVERCAMDRLRSEAARGRREQTVARARGATDPAGEPWWQLANGERATWLAARLDELPAADRELLRARFAPDVTVAGAAAGLGLGADAAHGRLRRTLERLRRLAAEWWP